MKKYREILELDFETALKAAEQVLQENEHEEIYLLIGMIYDDEYEHEKAVEFYQKAIKFNPGNYLCYLVLGKYHKEQYNNEDAKINLEKALELNPCYETYAWNGISEMHQDNDKAISYLTKALEVGSSADCVLEKPETYQELGLLYFYQGEYEKAIECYWHAHDEFGRAYVPHSDVIEAYIELQNYDEALKTANDYLDYVPNNAMLIYQKKGEIYTKMGQYDDAIRQYDFSIDWYCKNGGFSVAEAYNKKAWLLYKHMNDFGAAETVLKKAIDLEPDEIDLYKNLLGIYRDANMPEKIISFIESNIDGKFLDYTYDLWKIKVMQATAYLDLEDYNNVIATCEKAIELDNEGTEAYELITQVYHQLNEIDKAIVCYDEGIAATNCSYLYRSKRKILAKLKYFDEALAVADEMIEKDIDKAYTLFDKAMILSDLGRNNEAIATYMEFNKEKPDTVRAYINLFNCYRDIGQPEKALQACETVINSDEDNIKYYSYWQRAGVLYDRGQIEAAIADYEAAYNINPTYEHILTDLPEIYIIAGEYEKSLKLLEEGIAKKDDAYSQAIYHFMKFMIYFLTGENEKAKVAEEGFLAAGKHQTKRFPFTIRKILKYLNAAPDKMEIIREVGSKYFSV